METKSSRSRQAVPAISAPPTPEAADWPDLHRRIRSWVARKWGGFKCDDREDVASEVVLAAWARFREAGRSRDLLPWCLGVARNLSAKILRTGLAESAALTNCWRETTWPADHASPREGERPDQLSGRLLSLRPLLTSREIQELDHWIAGMSAVESAAALRVSSRAIRKLRAQVRTKARLLVQARRCGSAPDN